MKHQHYHRQDGITLYLSMLLMGTAVTIALFVSGTFVRELRISTDVVNSMKAVYVADTATEYTLYQVRIAAGTPPDLGTTPLAVVVADERYNLSTSGCTSAILASAPDTQCSLEVFTSILPGSVPGCPATTTAPDCTRVETRGAFQGVNRAMEIVYENL